MLLLIRNDLLFDLLFTLTIISVECHVLWNIELPYVVVLSKCFRDGFLPIISQSLRLKGHNLET